MMGESSGGEDSVVRSHGLVYRFRCYFNQALCSGTKILVICIRVFGTYDTRIDGVHMLQVI